MDKRSPPPPAYPGQPRALPRPGPFLPGADPGSPGARRHLYGIIQVEEDLEFPILNGHGQEVRAYTIRYQGLAAVASLSLFPHTSSFREGLVAHERIIEEVMREFTVLPLRFGVKARSDGAVVEGLLKPYFRQFHALLRRLEYKEELNLKAFRVRGRLSDHVPAGERWGADYILAQLSPLACEVRANPIPGDYMVLNAAFLVWRDQEEAFDRKVAQISGEAEGRLRFKYVGPVSPSHFVPPALAGPRPL